MRQHVIVPVVKRPRIPREQVHGATSLEFFAFVIPERQRLKLRRPVVGKPFASGACLASARIILQDKNRHPPAFPPSNRAPTQRCRRRGSSWVLFCGRSVSTGFRLCSYTLRVNIGLMGTPGRGVSEAISVVTATVIPLPGNGI